MTYSREVPSGKTPLILAHTLSIDLLTFYETLSCKISLTAVVLCLQARYNGSGYTGNFWQLREGCHLQILRVSYQLYLDVDIRYTVIIKVLIVSMKSLASLSCSVYGLRRVTLQAIRWDWNHAKFVRETNLFSEFRSCLSAKQCMKLRASLLTVVDSRSFELISALCFLRDSRMTEDQFFSCARGLLLMRDAS